MAELNVSRKNIKNLFAEMQNKKFLVPEYQRPYKWDEEKCETLWEDITNFHAAIKGEDEYFLGTIVTYKNDNYIETVGETQRKIPAIEIIDGQQRITSIFLLLRAFYKKLEKMTESSNVWGLKNQIAPCIWDINPISQEVTDKKKIHIASLVATDEDKATFHNILETGEVKDNATDLYSINYRYFYTMCERFAEIETLHWENLCVTILQKCIVLPIECDVQDTALTIFSTLNDRGMPLADSDIFKAQIYQSRGSEEEKKEFTNTWKDLTSTCKLASISLDDVFRCYSHTLRAKDKDKSKEIGLRKFYAISQYKKLKSFSLLDDLMHLSNFWLYLKTDKKNDEITFDLSIKSKMFLHCLSLYPNEYWKYITSVFYLKNKDNNNFSEELTSFLKKLTAFLFVKFIEKPTVNAIKDDIYQMCIAAQQGTEINFNFEFDENVLKSRIRLNSSWRLARALILLHAYLNEKQKDLLPITFDVEHIFPRKWQTTNYFGWSIDDAQVYLESFGNKVALEKKLNIQAGNGYFGIKKQKYLQSKIQDVLELGNLAQADWTKQDIEEREAEFIERLFLHFKELLNK